ncbi:hypothetical protein BOX15_Mlig029962g4, partial [Macrostomum lignano]
DEKSKSGAGSRPQAAQQSDWKSRMKSRALSAFLRYPRAYVIGSAVTFSVFVVYGPLTFAVLTETWREIKQFQKTVGPNN